MPKKGTKLTCPKCGQEFAIPEYSHPAAGIAIGKDANLGEIHPATVDRQKSKPKMNAQQRIDALKAAGVDVSGLYAMNMANGDTSVVRMTDGEMQQLADNDPIFNAIMENGTIPERRLFRRWVMAQMFHMLADIADKGKKNIRNIEDILRMKGTNYMWKTILEEYRVQAVLAKNDPENFAQRNLFFNRYTAAAIVKEFLKKTEKEIEKIKELHCKGIPYKKVNGKNIFTADIQKKVIQPLKDAALNIEKAYDEDSLYLALVKFNRTRKKLFKGNTLLQRFASAYKGAGAYFTLRNLILFHGCTLPNDKGERLNTDDSLTELDTIATGYAMNWEEWKMFAFLKETLSDNGIDINAKMNEWKNK